MFILFLLVIKFREIIESEKRLNRAQKNTKSGSYEYHLATKEMFWSDENYELLEADKNTFKPSFETFGIFIHPEDRETIKGQYDRGESFRSDYRIVMEDGSVKHIHEEVFFEYKEDRKIIEMRG